MANELVTLPPSVTSRGLDVAAWNTLCNSLFPGAKPDSVLMAVDYCKARQLDVMKKPCHIVPIWMNGSMRDVIMPGIYEYRMTAHRTKEYLGHTKPEYGEVVEVYGVEAPEWCEMTVKRWHTELSREVEYPQRVYFTEVCGTKKDKDSGEQLANERWRRSPIQMLTKCTEAAGLREAFPDELGGTYTEDEMYGKVIDVTPTDPAAGRADARESNGKQHSETTRRGKPAVKEPEAKAHVNPDNVDSEDPPPVMGSKDTIIKSQQTLIEQRLKRAGIPETEFCAQFEIGQISELLFDDMQRASEWIAQQSEKT